MFRDFKREVETSLKNAIKKTQEKKGIEIIDPDENQIDLKLEEPREIADLASTIPFTIASSIGVNPVEIGREIKNQIDTTNTEYIDRVEFSDPGYINFYLNQDKLPEIINRVLQQKNMYGYLEEKNNKIILEHTSANPTGPLHVGHLRNAVIGDTLSRILSAAGNNVETHYYINDTGRQMAILLTGIKKYGLDDDLKPDKAIGETYTKTNKNMDSSDEETIEEIIHKFDENDSETMDELKMAVEHCLTGIKQTLKGIGVQHDEYVHESRFIENGSVEEVLGELEQYTTKDEALKIEFEDMDKDLVLLRENGTTVYALRDIAYHKWKSKKGKMLNILGSDHKLYIKQLEKTLELLDIEKPESIVFEFVSLPTGKMSTREGEYISIDQLKQKLKQKALQEVKDRRPEKPDEWHQKTAEKVAKAAIRYEFTEVAPEKPITFNLEKAVSFNEKGAPFIQYAHARASSILQKTNREITKDINKQIEKPETKKLLKTISRYSYELEKAAEERKIHKFAEYTLNLASDFNQFYRDVPVIGTQKEKTRLAIVKATQITLKNAINLLGFQAPKEM